MKKTMIIVALMIFGMASMVSLASAVYVDTEAEYLTLTDTDGINDSIFSIAWGCVNNTTQQYEIGIYSFFIDDAGNTELDKMLRMIDYTTPNTLGVSMGTISFDLASGVATNNLGDTANIGKDFGIYFKWKDEDTSLIYTHAYLNALGDDLFQIALSDDPDAPNDIWDAVVVCDDFTLGVIDAVPAPIPSSIDCLLIGLGLAGLGLVRKRN